MSTRILAHLSIAAIVFAAPRIDAQQAHSPADMKAMAAHMEMTALRAPNSADSARAAKLVTELRSSIDKYRDVGRAVDDGFRQFAPQMKNQRIYHFTNYSLAFRNAFRFDPSKPTSLLYKKDEQGRFVLTGAMYTAPKRFSADKLNARVPLSIAQWHKHVNWCLPKKSDDPAQWLKTRNGQPVFGPLGVATREECESAGGRFEKEVFGWMVHANVFLSDDPRVIWGDDHRMSGEEMLHRH